MYSFDQNALMNNQNYYTTQDSSNGFYQAVDTSSYEQIKATNMYRNMVINRCNFKKGTKTKTNKKTKQQETVNYEIITLELIDNVNRKRLSVAVNLTNKVRLNELMYLTGVKDFEPKQIEKQDGTSFFVIEEFLGKMIDVIVDGFQYNQAGYLACYVLGFFKDTRSPQEIMANIKDANDYKKCLAYCKGKIGEPLQDANQPPMMANNSYNQPMQQAPQARTMPSTIPQQQGYAPNGYQMPAPNIVGMTNSAPLPEDIPF